MATSVTRGVITGGNIKIKLLQVGTKLKPENNWCKKMSIDTAMNESETQSNKANIGKYELLQHISF